MRKLAVASLAAGLLLGSLGAKPALAQQTLAAWSSGTTCGAVGTGATQTILPLGSTGVSAVTLQLDQTTTLTGGAMTIEGSFDATVAAPNWVNLPAANVINPTSSTLAQLGNPYTFVASTNQSFLVLTGGFTQIRIRCSTTITGTGSITPIITPVSFSVMEPQLLAQLVTAVNGNIPGPFGQATMSASLPVVIASNQTAIPTSVTTWASGTLGSMANYGTSPGAVLVPGVNAFVTNANANGQATMANSAPVVIASNQSTLSVNTLQINGVAVLTGTGAVGTGAQRVAIGTDTATIAGSAPGTAGTASANVVTIQGVASMTKVLVTPDSVALPANQSVNVAQINGVTPLMGNGVSGTGSTRVNLSSDNSAVAGLGAGATGSAMPANAVYQGVNTGNVLSGAHICGSQVTKHITTATDTQILAASGSTNIYVCDYEISFGGTGNIYLEKATTGTCATLTQIGQTWYGVANAGKAAGNAYYRGLNTGASAQLCANTSAGVSIDVTVYYDQY